MQFLNRWNSFPQIPECKVNVVVCSHGVDSEFSNENGVLDISFNIKGVSIKWMSLPACTAVSMPPYQILGEKIHAHMFSCYCRSRWVITDKWFECLDNHFGFVYKAKDKIRSSREKVWFTFGTLDSPYPSFVFILVSRSYFLIYIFTRFLEKLFNISLRKCMKHFILTILSKLYLLEALHIFNVYSMTIILDTWIE